MIRKHELALALSLGLSVSAVGAGLWVTEGTLDAATTCQYWGSSYSPGACIKAFVPMYCSGVLQCQSNGNWSCISNCNPPA